jgi:hypothetical protein
MREQRHGDPPGGYLWAATVITDRTTTTGGCAVKATSTLTLSTLPLRTPLAGPLQLGSLRACGRWSPLP